MGESGISLNKEFSKLLPMEIEKHFDDLLILREFLIRFKDNGMDKESMLKNMEELRSRCDSEETENLILELMDFIVGWCNPNLAVFDANGSKAGSGDVAFMATETTGSKNIKK